MKTFPSVYANGTPLTGNKLWPNPTNGLLHVEIPEFTESNVVLEVVGLDGKILLQQAVVAKITTINLEQLEKGLYILKISQEKNQYIRKFMKN